MSSLYGLIPPWHLHLMCCSEGMVPIWGHLGCVSQEMLPDTQLLLWVHRGLLSWQPLSRKHVMMPRKLKKVYSAQPLNLNS